MTKKSKKPISTYQFPEGITEDKNINPQNEQTGNPWVHSTGNESFFGIPGSKKQEQEQEQASSTNWEKIGANFTRENSLFSGISDYVTLFEMPDNLTPSATPENYNSLEHTQGYEEYTDRFAYAETPFEVEFLKRKIDKERKNKEIQEEGGWLNFTAGLAAGIIDPINLVPVGGAARVTYKSGESFLKGMVATGRAGLLGSSLSEVALHSTQETRTFGESAMNVAGGTLLSGVLGGSIGAFSSARKTARTLDELSNAIENDFKVPAEGQDYLGGDKIKISKEDLEHDTNIYKSVSAAAPNRTEAKLKKLFGAENLAFNPVIRTATSESRDARIGSQLLADPGLQYEDNALGIATPFSASTIVNHLKDSTMTRVMNALDSGFTSYKKREGALPINERTVVTDSYGISAKDNLLNQDEFRVEVSKALRRKGNHPIPEIRQAADDLRKDLNYYRDLAIDVGLLDERYKTEDTDYLHRIYDIDKIKAKREDFKRTVEDWLRGDADLALDTDELSECANQIIDKITGESYDRIDYSGVRLTSKTRGPLKERVFNIPDQLIEEFLVNDAEAVMRRYVNTMSADITLHKMLGDVQGTDLLAKIKDDWNRKIRDIKVEDSDLPKRREYLLKQLEDDYKKQTSVELSKKQKNELDSVYTAEKQFIEQATPDEVISRRNNLKLLDGRLSREIQKFHKKAWEKEDKKALSKYRQTIKNLANKDKKAEIDTVKENMNQEFANDYKEAKKYKDQLDSLFIENETLEIKHNKLKEELETYKARKKKNKAEYESKTKQYEIIKEEYDNFHNNFENKVDILNKEHKKIKLKIKRNKQKFNNRIIDIIKKYQDENILKKYEETKTAKRSLARMNKRLEVNKTKGQNGVLPEISDAMKLRQEKLLVDYKTSRDAILEAKPRSIAAVDNINASRQAELSTLREADPNYNARVIDINNKYDDMISKLNVVDKNALKKINKMEKLRDRDINDITSMISIIRGTFKKDSKSILDAYGLPRATKFIKTWNFTRMLGQTMLSAIPDIGGIVFVNGFTRTMGDCVLPLIRNINGIMKSKITGNKDGLYYERRQEIKDLGIANEILLNSRSDALADIGNQYSVAGLETYSRKFSKNAAYFSGITWWNEKLKTMAAYAAQAKLLRASTKDVIPPRLMNDLASYGVDKNMLKRIGSEFEQFGQQGDGVMVAGISGWQDREAADIFALAIRKIVDNTILTPHLEKPLFFYTPMGGLLGQFKSFGMAAYQRYFLAGIQRRDLSVMSGALSMMSLGAFSQTLKELYANGEVRERSPAEWISLGVDKSGLLGHLMDAENVLNKFTGGIVGIDSMTTGKTKRDYNYGLNALKSLGAMTGLAVDIAETASGTANVLVNGAKVDGKLLSATRRLIPFQNSITFRKAFDATEDYLRDNIGVRARLH